jgi:hypothetical protein
MGTLLVSLDPGKEITLLTIYGPYLDRVEYWDKIFQIDCLQNALVVLWGT